MITSSPSGPQRRFTAAQKEERNRRQIGRSAEEARKCAPGLDALRLYRAEHGDKHAALLPHPHPVHDWCSHAADAFRYLTLTLNRQSGGSGFHRRIDYPQHGVVRGRSPHGAFAKCGSSVPGLRKRFIRATFWSVFCRVG